MGENQRRDTTDVPRASWLMSARGVDLGEDPTRVRRLPWLVEEFRTELAGVVPWVDLFSDVVGQAEDGTPRPVVKNRKHVMGCAGELGEGGMRGSMSVLGFGSLLSPRSARSTFPSAKNFRLAEVEGWRRVFSHPAPVFFQCGAVEAGSIECSSLSCEPWDIEMGSGADRGAIQEVRTFSTVELGSSASGQSCMHCETKRRRLPGLLVLLFEIDHEDAAAYVEREHELRFVGVQVKEVPGGRVQYDPLAKLTQRGSGVNIEGDPVWDQCFSFCAKESCCRQRRMSPDAGAADHPQSERSKRNPWAVLCARFSDEEYKSQRCKDEAEFHERYVKHGVTKIWKDRDDPILPCRPYLRHCVLAARNLGKEVEDNFLDCTFLCDRKTTLRTYLERNPEIMMQLPPEALRERYSG